MERLVALALWLAAIGQVMLVGVSVQIPARLGWRDELPRIEVRNRKLYLVSAGYIVLTYLGFAVLTLLLQEELIRGDRAALALATFIGLFWLVRLIVDFTWFGHGMWPAGKRFVLAHFLLDGLFAAFTVTYFGVVIWHLIR